MNAVIDEDLPRSFHTILTKFGFTVFDVRDYDLRGAPDHTVLQFTRTKKAILFTGDLDFSNIQTLSSDKNIGICIVRFPNEMSVSTVNHETFRLLNGCSTNDFLQHIVVVSPGKIRRRHISMHSVTN